MKFEGVNYCIDCSKLIDVVKKFNSSGSKTMGIKTSKDNIQFYCNPENNLDITFRSVILDVPEQENFTEYNVNFYLKPIYYFIKSMNSNKNNYNNVNITLSNIKNHNYYILSYKLGDFGTIYLISKCI